MRSALARGDLLLGHPHVAEQRELMHERLVRIHVEEDRGAPAMLREGDRFAGSRTRSMNCAALAPNAVTSWTSRLGFNRGVAVSLSSAVGT